MKGRLCFFIVLVFISSSTDLLASISISADGDELEFGRRTGRSLLQTKKNCPVDFENANYTVITSQCKAPEYSPSLCCKSFKEFACPYANVLNDDTNNCAVNMFSYINKHGNYPAGVFASICHEGKDGLSCPAASSPPQSESADSSQGRNLLFPSLVVGFFFCLF